MNEGVIDRFEGEYAVIEYGDRKTFDLPRCLLHLDAAEGDVISIEVTIDEEETLKRKKEIEELTKNLFRD